MKPLAAVTPTRVLVVICLAFVTFASVVAFATPPGEANDEQDHVRNAETLASGRFYRIEEGAGLEPLQPPLYYLGLAAGLRLFGADPLHDALPRAVDPGTAVFRHDVRTDAAAQRRFTLLRIPSIVFGLCTILLTAAIGRRVSKNRWTPVVAAGIVALVPKFVFLSGVVNNDNLAITLAAAATLLSVVMVTEVLTPRRELAAAIGLGSLGGLLAITKFTTLPLIAAWVLTLLLARLRSRLVCLAAFVGSFLLLSGWWFWMNIDRYGDPLAKRASEEHIRGKFFIELVGDFSMHRMVVEVPRAIWWQFFYTSGWNGFRWSDRWYVPFWGLLLVGLVGLAVKLPSTGRRVLLVLAAVGVCSLASVWMVAISNTSVQARYALTGLPAVATLAALGYERLRIPVMLRFALPLIGVIGILVALHNDVFDAFRT